MTNKYFSTVQTYEELKAAYKALVKTMHPDLGGNTQDFQEMQNEYEEKAKSMGKTKGAARQDMANAWGLVRGMRVICYGYAMNSKYYVVTRATAEGCDLVQVGTPCNGVDFFEYDETVADVEEAIYNARLVMSKSYDHVKPLSKKFGIGYYFDDVEGKTYTEEEIKAAELRAANIEKFGELAKADRQRKADEAEKAAYLAELATINEWRTRLEIIPEGAKDATKKAILKRNIKAVFAYYFPGVKVTVKDTNKTWCEDSRICWVDGPTVEEVMKIEAFGYFRAYGWAAPDPCEDYGHRTTLHSLQKFRQMFGAFSADSIDYERTLSPEAEAVINAALDAYEFEGRDEFGRITRDTDSALLTWSDIETIAAACGLENIHDINTRTKGAEALVSYCLRNDAGDNKMRVYRSNLADILRDSLKVSNPTPKAEKATTETPQAEELGAAPEGLELVETSEGVAIVGDAKTTYKNRKAIKAHGAKWNKNAQRWEATDAESVASLRQWFGMSDEVATDKPTTESATECPQADEIPTDEPTNDQPTESATESATECPAWAAAFVDMVGTFADAFNIATECPQADEIPTDEPTNDQPTESATDSENGGKIDIIYFSPDDCPDLPELQDVESLNHDPNPNDRQPLSDEEAARVRRVFECYLMRVKECEEDYDNTAIVYNYGLALLTVLHSSKVFEINNLLDQVEAIARKHHSQGHITPEEMTQRKTIARTLCRYAIDYAGRELAALLFRGMADEVANEMKGAA